MEAKKQLLDALQKISGMTMSMYTSAGEAMRDAKRIAREAIAAAEQAQQATVQDCTFTNCGPAYVVGVGEVTAQQAEPVARDVLMAFGEDVRDCCFWAWHDAKRKVVAEADAINKVDITAIVDRYAAQPPAVAEGCGACGDGCKGRGCRMERESPSVVAQPVAHPCWSCGRLVTAERRAAADGDCPNCGAELDHEDWPAAAQKGGE